IKRDPTRQARLRRVSAEAVIAHARKVLGSIVRPTNKRVVPLSELPSDEAGAASDSIDLEATLEQVPVQEIWVEHSRPRTQPLILSIDTSLSMTGDKLALTAVALAVVRLEFPEDPIGVIAFENEAQLLLDPVLGQKKGLGALIEAFLDVPAQGYTHLENGILAALKMQKSMSESNRACRPPSVILLTDGKYTAGRDPEYLAPRFTQLHVLKMGNEVSGIELCRDLARRGHGSVREVARLEDLPQAMYALVKELLRGRR
ncbi:MAG: VWA domain-containing protein, partial [Bdellovibrionota bacterium]